MQAVLREGGRADSLGKTGASKGAQLRILVAGMIVLCGTSSISAAQTAFESDWNESDVCSAIASNLVPLKFSNAKYVGLDGVTGGGGYTYTGHKLAYTSIVLAPDMPDGDVRMAVFSGKIFRTDQGKQETEFLKAAVASGTYFEQAGWARGPTTDLNQWPATRWDLRTVHSVLAFMAGGRTADERLRGNPSNFYSCQACDGAPAFADHLAQKTETVRFARVKDHIYMVTTAPMVVGAVISYGRSAARYFQCPSAVGKAIDADTDRIKRELDRSRPIDMEPTG